MKTWVLSLGLVGTVLAVSLPAQAHRAWITPAATQLSAENSWVGFDAAISNDIFHADHRPMGLEAISVISPSGEKVELQNAQVGKHRSVFDIALAEQGTYKAAVSSATFTARWVDEEGKRAYFPPRGQIASAKEVKKAIPKKAKELEISQNYRRIETFVTAGAPSKGVFAVNKQGLELSPITHPNDLYAGEAASFQLLINGKPAANAKVSAIRDGMRYRNQQDAIEVSTDKDGKFSITWPQAGMYWLNANYADDKADKPASKRAASYTAVVEVLPE